MIVSSDSAQPQGRWIIYIVLLLLLFFSMPVHSRINTLPGLYIGTSMFSQTGYKLIKTNIPKI